MKKIILLAVFIFGPVLLFEQQFVRRNPHFNPKKVESYESVSILAILEKSLAENPDSAVLVKTKRLDIEIPQENFMFEDSVVYKYLLQKFPKVKRNEKGQIIIPNYLYIDIDSMNIVPLRIEGFEFSMGLDIHIKGSSRDFSMESCAFTKEAKFRLYDGIFLSRNIFREGLYINNQVGRLFIEGNEIFTPGLNKEIKDGPYVSYPYAVDITSSPLEFFEFTDNKVIDTGKNGSISNFNIRKIDQLTFTGNTLDGLINLSGILIERRVTLKENTINGKICLYDFIFPQNFNKVYWNQFSGMKLTIIKKKLNKEFGGFLMFVYNPSGDSLTEENHKDLIVSYKSLHTIFNNNGDTESGNGCYAEKKDVEGTWLKHIYIENGGFKNYLNYKLNRLLKFYTNHGTDPSLAIIISIYVLLGFTVFYLFFPSEWDVASKSRLLKNFRDFTEKNNKGYFKPFIYMVLWIYSKLFKCAYP